MGAFFSLCARAYAGSWYRRATGPAGSASAIATRGGFKGDGGWAHSDSPTHTIPRPQPSPSHQCVARWTQSIPCECTSACTCGLDAFYWDSRSLGGSLLVCTNCFGHACGRGLMWLRVPATPCAPCPSRHGSSHPGLRPGQPDPGHGYSVGGVYRCCLLFTGIASHCLGAEGWADAGVAIPSRDTSWPQLF